MSRFSVLQFNMQFGQVWDDAYPDHAPVDLEQTIAEIKRQDADIILLQEVEHAEDGGKQINPPPNYTRLKAALSDYDSYFSYPKQDERELPFGIGLAIFSRSKLFDTTKLDLPSPPIEFNFNGETKTPTDRLLIGAKTDIGGKTVQLFNTHLLAFFMLKSSSTEHPEQRQMVVDQLKLSKLPALLGGDFNVSGHETLVSQFEEAGFSTAQWSEITWRRMPLVLDHVFFNEQLRCISQKVIPTPSSDHHLLLVELELKD
ncbi:MAG: endonuclease/exonuclease/phosphatase family protein [Gammaproteobacteria bacterium]|nr:endonuclease/exonuclease/phosphatase family protein [Gammaproteobacteria bacterium]MBU1625590.1 endonuclease/exonuclease/phosphatase family protein [Gammaproteobacteria bacterium]MBU1980850.1 endonuclease/exonuclease/phosphatase family protein [Gammaproteobacteria bacterium]